MADLVKGGWHGLVTKKEGDGTSNVGVISGGEATNVVTDHVHIRAEARSHDPKFRQRIVKEIESAFKRAAAAVRSANGTCGRVRFDGRLDYESFRLSRDEPCVAAAAAAIEAENLTAEFAITNGGLDANWLTAHGIPDRDARLRPAEYPHGPRATRYRRVPPGPANRTSASHGVDFSVG